jgi:hypothetical protein
MVATVHDEEEGRNKQRKATGEMEDRTDRVRSIFSWELGDGASIWRVEAGLRRNAVISNQ